MISFNTLRTANTLRLPQFKNCHGAPAHSQPDGSDWSRADWLEAVTGELGEYANMSKKYRRGDITHEEFMASAKRELADVVTYLDILAMQLGINLGDAVREKFNEISSRVRSTIYIREDAVVELCDDLE